MDKQKLVRIITNDLEEIKTFTDEVLENQGDNTLVIELAISRARLLCQELEVLKSLSLQTDSLTEEIEDGNFEDNEDDLSEISTTDPELEILHFDEPGLDDELDDEYIEEDQQDFDEDEQADQEEETEEDDFQEEEEEEEEEDVLEEDNIDEEEEDEYIAPDLMEVDLGDTGEEIEEDAADEEFESEEVEEEEFEEEMDDEEDEDVVYESEDEDLEENENDEEPEDEAIAQANKAINQAVREIEINELDDEEDEDVEFAPVTSAPNRPVFREIPKPEIIETRIPFETEPKAPEVTPQKERSINEQLGEKKAAETPLSNSPISSLRATIGLNDRILFIKEIFNNNDEKYNTIIDQLDKMDSIQEAVDYLKRNLSLQKNETSLKFVDLLKRRFSK
jgi:hypothetical protein